ncbi:energy-coupling factor transporter transmembrane protein EcfT [Picosynechococcus sp. NKBG15041c]|uniref:energy-coupling factor transporter transmembrane component T family protein n=1 Tax=Picosynechococcus sp. NKBG15041c TaxID=1407650 RepID=UPI00041E5FFB|nr:energy-coupling factor transporter transmembrane protein EcfT [Picosynechococcus sp. NKBG15041c]
MDLMRSLPLGLYLEQPQTWLHRLDPRVKLAWLMTFLFGPILANNLWRVGLVGLLIAITLTALIPLRVWKQQMGLLLLFCFALFVVTLIAPDGLVLSHQPRLPAEDLDIPQSYNYVVWQFRFISITRLKLDLGIKLSTQIFTLLYSTNLYLLTTAAEEITTGLEFIFSPLRRWRIPVTEILLTLTLSLRFIPLVLEEIQNLTRSVRTRAIAWKTLGFKQSAQLWLMVSEKLLENLLMRAEQIATAMDIRGFTSPNRHRVRWHQLRFHPWDWLILILLIPFWSLRFLWG